jgi:hypothetical protein
MYDNEVKKGDLIRKKIYEKKDLETMDSIIEIFDNNEKDENRK